MNVMAEEIKTQKAIKVIEVSRLDFDPENPRLPSKYRNESEKAALKYLIIHGRILDLINSIGKEGYFEGEPLLVVKSEQQSDKYIVVEGNRRLAALKLLLNPELATVKRHNIGQAVADAKHKPTEVPCVEFEKREDVLSYLGYRHITGSQEWSPLSKSRFLYQLYKREASRNPGSTDKRIYQEIARFIGSRSDYVARLLRAYKVYLHIEDQNFWEINKLNEETIDYSLIYTALSFSGLNQFIFKNPEQDSFEELTCDDQHVKEFTRWVFEASEKTGETRVRESRNLKHLNSIVKDPPTLESFRQNDLPIEEAALYTEEPAEAAAQWLVKSDRALKQASDNIYKAKSIDLNRKKELSEMVKEITRKCNLTQSMIESSHEV